MMEVLEVEQLFNFFNADSDKPTRFSVSFHSQPAPVGTVLSDPCDSRLQEL